MSEKSDGGSVTVKGVTARWVVEGDTLTVTTPEGETESTGGASHAAVIKFTARDLLRSILRKRSK